MQSNRDNDRCSILWQVMRHPARASDGLFYELNYLYEQIVLRNNPVSPFSGIPFTSVKHAPQSEAEINAKYGENEDRHPQYDPGYMIPMINAMLISKRLTRYLPGFFPGFRPREVLNEFILSDKTFYGGMGVVIGISVLNLMIKYPLPAAAAMLLLIMAAYKTYDAIQQFDVYRMRLMENI